MVRSLQARRAGDPALEVRNKLKRVEIAEKTFRSNLVKSSQIWSKFRGRGGQTAPEDLTGARRFTDLAPDGGRLGDGGPPQRVEASGGRRGGRPVAGAVHELAHPLEPPGSSALARPARARAARARHGGEPELELGLGSGKGGIIVG